MRTKVNITIDMVAGVISPYYSSSITTNNKVAFNFIKLKLLVSYKTG